MEESAGLKVKTSRPTVWNDIVLANFNHLKWAKSTGVFTLNHKSRFDNHILKINNPCFISEKDNNYAVEYVTTRDGYETDFLARHKITKEEKLIQVSWKISEKPTFERELRGLKKAMAELSIPSGEIVTWDDEARIDDAISIAPAWKWLL